MPVRSSCGRRPVRSIHPVTFPVAGSIYQWSKRLSNRTLGWFTGWFYFWAQVVTVTAVVHVPPPSVETCSRKLSLSPFAVR